MFELLPAVDVQEGKAVRLTQGKLGTEKQYGTPLSAALFWQELGAKWLHLVDLDAAFGTGNNYSILSQVISQLNLNIELSGGIRDTQTLTAALETGCTRINLGTAALEQPEWCDEVIKIYGEKIAVGLDVLPFETNYRLRARGWVKDGGDLWEVLSRLNQAGCACVVVTDVSRDGALNGPNLNLLNEVAKRTDAKIIASGGISSLDDIKNVYSLRNSGISGLIVGKALYESKFDLTDALKITEME